MMNAVSFINRFLKLDIFNFSTYMVQFPCYVSWSEKKVLDCISKQAFFPFGMCQVQVLDNSTGAHIGQFCFTTINAMDNQRLFFHCLN
jgi:hypothetical protein